MSRTLTLPKGKIGPSFTPKILPWIENFWHQKKRYPTDLELMDHFGFSREDLDRIHASKFYLRCLEDRGITHKPGYFTEIQQAAISLITNVHDTRPNKLKLEAIGVTPEMYQGWMQNPEFYGEVQRRVEDVLDHIYPDAQTALAKQVKNGNMTALKFYYEMTGRAQSPELLNVKVMMNRVIEAVQKHVKDPEILQAIAYEIQSAERASVAPALPELPQARNPLSSKGQ